MVSQRTRLLAAALLTAVLFRLAGSQDPFSTSWTILLGGSALSAVLLVRELREYQF